MYYMTTIKKHFCLLAKWESKGTLSYLIWRNTLFSNSTHELWQAVGSQHILLIFTHWGWFQACRSLVDSKTGSLLVTNYNISFKFSLLSNIKSYWTASCEESSPSTSQPAPIMFRGSSYSWFCRLFVTLSVAAMTKMSSTKLYNKNDKLYGKCKLVQLG